VWEAAATPEAIPGLGAAAVKALRRFMDTMGHLRAMTGLPGEDRRASGERAVGGAETAPTPRGVPIGVLLEALLSQSGYVDALEAERTIEAQGRIENLEQLVEVGREFDAGVDHDSRPPADTLDVFLQQIALVADADTRSDDEGLVTLMTLHNAKGLEYPIVFIAGCEDGVFPHSRAVDEGGLEEERRLFYVGITRAMRQLYLTYARRRAVFGAQTFGLPSRFLDEIPVDLLDDRSEIGRQSAFRPGGQSGGVGWGRSTVTAGAGDGGQSSWARPATGAETIVARRGREPRPQTSQFRLGEDVVHAAFGDGVVTGVEPDGVIVVRFAGDGSERKLMAEYAPVTRR
jgi:DNA helicase-2/ATP-dependent DNA helicase PcrA